MKGQRGFTLVELIVVSALLTTAVAVIGGVVFQMRREQALAEAYDGDLRQLQAAVQALESDLVGATELSGTVIDKVAWTLSGDRLLRGNRLIAERVAEFSIERKGDLAVVRLALQPRDREAARRTARVVTKIRLMGMGAGR